MTHGSLFSGIGGFDLAAEWMGWENIFHCEWNPFGQKVLKHYWPKAISYHDITKTDFTIHRGSIDIITGGFPCQPYSTAGKRKGKEDERHLWPEMLRTIREVQPRWVVGENVFGLVNWSGGLVFHEVQTDLEAEGYEVWPYVLPAAAVGAPHRRDRVWFVAHANGNGLNQRNGNDEEQPSEGRFNALCDADKGNKYGNVADTEPKRLQGQCGERERRSEHWSNEGIFIGSKNKFNAADINCIQLRGQSNEIGKSRFTNQEGKIGNWHNFPTQSPICTGNDGLSPRLDGITFPKWRNESIKAAGNAIVPQVVLPIFRAIEQYEQTPA
jgi:DNA (cytosine-5)-methyltransferase 1